MRFEEMKQVMSKHFLVFCYICGAYLFCSNAIVFFFDSRIFLLPFKM